MSRIFICYRREDSSGHAGRLHDALTAALGEDRVFIDVGNIPLGVDFVDVIEKTIEGCSAVVAVIGRNWLSAADDHGNRKLEQPHDFVRIEIATGLARGIRVIPVLVHGAKLPRSEELPEPLAKLARRNGMALRDESWKSDVQRLISELEPLLSNPDTASHQRENIGGAEGHLDPELLRKVFEVDLRQLLDHHRHGYQELKDMRPVSVSGKKIFGTSFALVDSTHNVVIALRGGVHLFRCYFAESVDWRTAKDIASDTTTNVLRSLPTTTWKLTFCEEADEEDLWLSSIENRRRDLTIWVGAVCCSEDDNVFDVIFLLGPSDAVRKNPLIYMNLHP